MMKKLILSSVGTSLLTNAVDGAERKELTRLANKTSYENDAHQALIERRQTFARNMLNGGDDAQIRVASAELNGIYGIYGGNLPQNCQDMHFLITTDTIQGKITGSIVKDFLHQRGISADVVTLNRFSTEKKSNFSDGIQDLLKWCDETIEGYRESRHEVIFNLTGGFKSQQGFMNTIGMFYADKIVYIFESGSDLIEIPRLPIVIDKTTFEKHKLLFLQHYAGKIHRKQDFSGIPETLYDVLDNDIYPSIWGELSWNKVKTEILSKELVKLPNLIYESSIERDFKDSSADNDKTKLQEVLAKVSVLLQRSNGDIGELKRDGGLLYEDYNNQKVDGSPVGHFRVSQRLRVSCIKDGENLRLRHYGEHNYVNDNP